MKLNELKCGRTDSTRERPCELVAKFLQHEEQGGTMASFVEQFDFESREEMAAGIRQIVRAIALDNYMSKSHLKEDNPAAAAIFARYNKIHTDASKAEKYPTTTSGEIWHGGYSRRKLKERTEALLAVVPDAAKCAEAAARIKRVYGLTDNDLAKIRFFIEQAKAGERFPNSMRRVLYLWGKVKWTGKTTCGRIIASILNGYKDASQVDLFSSDLSRELQIQSFATPKIAEWNAVFLDEIFYSDMTRTYSKFKRFITSSNGTARLPFGQEFRWEGFPNYVATSNDSLKVFIKDWDDRRYLAVEFKQTPAEKMSDDEVAAMWYDYIVNCEPTGTWRDMIDAMQDGAEEKGDRADVAEELEVELQQADFIRHLKSRTLTNLSPANPENHVPLKFFVDYFSQSMGATEAHRRRGEIEEAVKKVYGKRYSSSNYWLLSALQVTAVKLEKNITGETWSEGDTDGVPF